MTIFTSNDPSGNGLKTTVMDLASMPFEEAEVIVADIAKRWLALEVQAQPDFFLKWDWISLWLEKLTTRPLFVVVSDGDGKDIACGFFVQHRQIRHKIFKINQLRLHSTGVREHDDINIEYNNLLCVQSDFDIAWQVVIRCFMELQKNKTISWHEIIVQGATNEVEERLKRYGLTLHRQREQGAAFVDLKSLREKNILTKEGYISVLGKSTRSQLRRSIKLYEKKGPLVIECAKNLTQAREYLFDLTVLHNAKWNRLERVGSMESDFFSTFSYDLLERCYDAGKVELLRVHAGDYVLGIIYNFINHDTAYFYLSGFVHEDDNKLKPGLVTHCLAIERYLNHPNLNHPNLNHPTTNDTLNVYDFMGGDNRYKLNLGERGPDIVTFALQRDSFVLRIENLMRKIKNGASTDK